MRVAIFLVMAGCSWSSMKQAPTIDPGTRPVPCTESRAAPTADVVGGAAFGGLALAGLAYGVSAHGDNEIEGPPAGIGFGLAAVAAIPATLYIMSAIRGYRSASRCQQLNHPELGPATDPNGFYLRTGVAAVPSLHTGTDTRVGPTVGFGYRGVTGAWLIDASAFNVNYWNLLVNKTADFPSAVRLGVHRFLQRAPSSSLYVGAAASVGQSLVQSSSNGPYLGGQYRWGPQVEAVLGAQLLEDRRMHIFFEANLIAPLVLVEETNNTTQSTDSIWTPTLQLSAGLVF